VEGKGHLSGVRGRRGRRKKLIEDLRLLRARSTTDDCDHCHAFDENPADFAEREVCPGCPWGREVDHPEIYRLLDYLALVESGCPVGRHELLDTEWRAIGAIKNERDRLIQEEIAEKHGRTPER
jgi:hypothetical protein